MRIFPTRNFSPFHYLSYAKVVGVAGVFTICHSTYGFSQINTGSAQVDARDTLAGQCQSEDAPIPGLTAKIGLTGSITRSRVDGEKFGADILAVNNQHPEACGPKRQRSRIWILASYDGKKKEGHAASITRNYSAHAQHLVYLPSNHFYVSGNARFMHNNTLGLYLQQSYSLLLGATVDMPAASVELNVGPGFVGQHFIESKPSEGFVAAVVDQHISIPLDFIRTNADLSENVHVALPLRADDPWIGNAFVTLYLPISPKVALTASAWDDYLSNPPTGADKNYFTTNLGLSISIGK